MSKPSFLSVVAAAFAPLPKAMPGIGQSVGSGGWYPIIRESFAGAWQRGVEINAATADGFYASFACKTLIARDVAKIRVKLVQRDADGIWKEVNNAAFSPVLRKPNHYQTRNQFWESWILSKLHRGNTYVLKGRDARGVVTALYPLDPGCVTPLVADDGSVFYRLASDNLNGLPGEVTVPATEIIHDRMNCLGHALVGVPPIMAAALAATQGLNIQTESVRLFANRATPSGILTADGHIPQDTADRLKKDWEDGFAGANRGKTAVLGDGLKFDKMSLTAEESQAIEQLKWTAEVVCSVYHVPPYKIGVGALPSYNNVQALNVEYFSQCLQSLIEDAETCLDEGLGLGEQYGLGTEFEVENLLRMDTVAQMDALEKGKNYMTPNEGRARLNLPRKPGGDSVYRQQQDYSLTALEKRDAKADPFGSGATPAQSPAGPPANENTVPPEQVAASAGKAMRALLGMAPRVSS